MSLIVNPGTSVQTLIPVEGRLLSLLVNHGRVGLYRPAGAEAVQPARVSPYKSAACRWTWNCWSRGHCWEWKYCCDSRIGIPLEPVEPKFDGGVFVVAGTAAIKSGDSESIVLSAGNGWLPWPVDGVWQPGPLLSQPQWLTPDGPILPPVKQTFANLYEQMFSVDRPVSVSIPAVVKDRRSTHATPIPSRPSAPSPTATAPTCASRRSAGPRCFEQAFFAATSPGQSCSSACPTQR